MAIRLNRWRNAGVVFVGAAILWACGGAPLKVAPVDKTDNPTEMIAQLGEDLTAARADQKDIFSPTWFKKAQTSYLNAKKGLERGEALSFILDNIGRGRAQLQQAGVVAIRCRDQLEETILSREAARTVKAQQYGDDYADVETDFLKLTRAMEDNDFKYARSRRKEVSERFRALELRAITQAAMGETRVLMQKAAEMNVSETAPKSYAEAQSALSQAESFIAQNRYDIAMIRQRADKTEFMAQRALEIAEASRKLAEMGPEDIALWMESFLYETTAQLKTSDTRNVSFNEQQRIIVGVLSALQAERAASARDVKNRNDLIQKLNERLNELEGTSRKVKYDKERLAAEKRFNDLFIKVQSYFDPDDAEVYKQLDTLVIRLKGIRFPVGQAVIQSASYPLMSKVQKSIRTFDQPEILIEGHTDSTGSTEKNQALSNSRAEAVKQYLVSNGTLSSKKISAVGHGASRPIASNKTAIGRAQNRRIDIIIKPQMKQMK